MADNTTDTNHDGKIDASEAHAAAERARNAGKTASQQTKPPATTTDPLATTLDQAGVTPLKSDTTPLAGTIVKEDQTEGKKDVTDQPNVDANTGRTVDFNPPVADPQVLEAQIPSHEVLRFTAPTAEIARVNPPDARVLEENKPQDIKDHEEAHKLPDRFQVRRTNVVTGETKRVEMSKDEFNKLGHEQENGQEIRYELVQF